MGELKAKDYRQMFLSEIGFPLIKANAKLFVADVGDLRKVENLKLVYEVAMQRKDEEERDRQSANESIRRELEAQVQAVQELEQQLAEKDCRIEELESKVEYFSNLQLPGSTNETDSERQLAEYVAQAPVNTAEEVILAILRTDPASPKVAYRRLSKVFHPDTTDLPKNKAAELFDMTRCLYEQIGYSQTVAGDIIDDNGEGWGVQPVHETGSWLDKDSEIEDIPF
jgi:hypothetical protein